VWLRWQHFLNLFFLIFIMRSGIQILASHPRLYWRRDSTPDTEWFRFQHAVPRDRVWTANDDAVALPGLVGLPGPHSSIGLARWWHFSFDLFWLVNGAIFYVLLFTSDQWQRLVPTSWEVFPNALSTQLQSLTVLYGAPLRLRCENELGFKMVKWIEAIEFVERLITWAPDRVATTKTTNSSFTACLSDGPSFLESLAHRVLIGARLRWSYN